MHSIGSAAIDPQTKNVYLQTTNGLFLAFTSDGKKLWEHSMMERFGRLTFPNGRTGAPIVEGDLVIMHCITSYWGKQGPARDRFYGFDKISGRIVWVLVLTDLETIEWVKDSLNLDHELKDINNSDILIELFRTIPKSIKPEDVNAFISTKEPELQSLFNEIILKGTIPLTLEIQFFTPS